MDGRLLNKILAIALVCVSVFAFNTYEENETLVSKNRSLTTRVSQLEDEVARLEYEVDSSQNLKRSTASNTGGKWTAEKVDHMLSGQNVYVSRTGTKYHSNPNCGNMSYPLVMSAGEAIDMGRDPCSKCY